MDAVHCDPRRLAEFPATPVDRHKKFAPGGAVGKFPGSTVICFVVPESHRDTTARFASPRPWLLRLAVQSMAET